jgi:hypothetical protein
MKNWKVVIVFFISVTAFSQRIIDREVGEFNEIKVYDLIAVNLIKSDENRILIKGPYADEIRYINRDGVLKLRMELNKRFQGNNTFVEVHYTDLRVIDANEGAKIVCNEQLNQKTIALRAQEGAQISAGLKVDAAVIRAVTGGIITVSGIAERQDITLNTGGVFEGRELKTSLSAVSIKAGGEAELFASEEVDIQISAGGDVSVWGSPERIYKKQLFGGRVYLKD